MAKEYGGGLFDFSTMADDEIREVVLEHLRESPALDTDDIDVIVREGTVTLAGRVGTDAEVAIATAVLDDVLGLDAYSNELVVDELRRGEASATEEELLGEEGDQPRSPADQQSDTAGHLVEDLDSETFGTTDVGRAIQDASAYSPPDHPTSDGYGSREDH